MHNGALSLSFEPALPNPTANPNEFMLLWFVRRVRASSPCMHLPPPAPVKLDAASICCQPGKKPCHMPLLHEAFKARSADVPLVFAEPAPFLTSSAGALSDRPPEATIALQGFARWRRSSHLLGAGSSVRWDSLHFPTFV
mmetsp:Transcript_43108/g.125478  ORF Transcript_43108/g.125478 Transcript_43108/m.125478 type:complete len:140 (+) Transcript_43108:891-1310(+)